jgi:hypothetical protein
LSFRAIPLEDAVGWRAVLSRLPHGFGHSWEACRAAWLTQHRPTWLFVWEGPGDGMAAAPFVERPTPGGGIDITTPLGFAGFTAAGATAGFLQAWADFARERGYISGYQALHPSFPHEGLYRPEDGQRDNSLYVFDLTVGEDALHAGLDRNRRRQLRAWRSSGHTIVEDREALTDFLVAQARPFLERRGASPSTVLDEDSLLLLGRSGSTLLVGSAQRGRVVSAYLFGLTRSVADAVMHISLPEGREDTTAVVWTGIRRLVHQRIPALNLGGGVREGDRIALAKQRFGAVRVPLVRIKEVYDRHRFLSECRRVGVDPEDRSGYFPPYQSPGPVGSPAAETHVGSARGH